MSVDPHYFHKDKLKYVNFDIISLFLLRYFIRVFIIYLLFYCSYFHCTTPPLPLNLLYSHKVVQLNHIHSYFLLYINKYIDYYKQLLCKYYKQNTIIVILYINPFNYMMYLSHCGDLRYHNVLPSYLLQGLPFQCILHISNCPCIAINRLRVVSAFTYLS